MICLCFDGFSPRHPNQSLAYTTSVLNEWMKILLYGQEQEEIRRIENRIKKKKLSYGPKNNYFLTFPACFSIPIIFSNFDFNCSNLSSLRNLQEQVKKAFCYQELFWPFTVWLNCSSDLKHFENSRLSVSNFKSFSRSLEQFFLTVGQNNFGNRIP